MKSVEPSFQPVQERPCSAGVPDVSGVLPCVPVPQQNGVLVLNKPKGPTSAWCISRVKRVLSQKKIGHAGTLDPMAGGVLLVLLGQATKISGYLMEGGEKIYSGVIRLGVVTDTWDAAGRVLAERPVSGITQEDVQRELAPLVGSYAQRVPAYSAAKHEGKPLYALARKGMDTPVKEKMITVSRCEAELVGPGRIHFRVTCSSGTYIRSLAHSLGSRLGCGGILEELTREHSHPFGIHEAHSLESVLSEPEGFAGKLVGIADALPGWPRIRVTAREEAGVRNGHGLPFREQGQQPFSPGTRALLLNDGDIPLALAEAVLAAGTPVWNITRGLWNNQ